MKEKKEEDESPATEICFTFLNPNKDVQAFDNSAPIFDTKLVDPYLETSQSYANTTT